MSLLTGLGTALGAAVAVALVFVLPGRLILRRALGRLPALEAAGLALVVGWMAVALLAHALNIVPLEVLPFIRIPAWVPVICAAGIVIAWGRRGVAGPDTPCPAPERREARILAIATVVVTGVYLLQYDRDLFAFTCTHRAVSIAARVDVGALWSAVEVPRVLLFDEENDMHGVVAILSVLPSLLGFFGVRLSYALLHAGLAGAAWVAVRRAGFGPPAGAVVFGLVALHPLMLGTPVDDVNHVALLSSAAVWTTLLVARREAHWTRDLATVAGLGTALAVGAWHPFLLSLPALALLIGRRELARPALGALLIGVVPFVVRHVVALGGPFTFESFAENAAVAHAVAGAEFAYSGLLNWPFAPELVRTPGNPLPVVLLLPAVLLATSGAGLAALAVVGLPRLDRRLGIAALLWLLPAVGLLAPQENWFEIEKLQIATVWLAPAVLALAAGIEGLATRRGAIGAAVVTLLLVAAGRSLAEVSVPVDPRLQARWPHLRDEDPAEVADWRDRLTRGSVLPRFDVLGPDPRTVRDRVAALGEELAAPRYADRPESPREMGLRLTIPEVWHLFLEPQAATPPGARPSEPQRAVSVDLAALPSLGPAVSVAPLPGGGDVYPHRGLRLPWSQAIDVVVFQQDGAPGDVHLLVAGPAPHMLADLERDFPELGAVVLPPPRPPRVHAVPWAVDGTAVVIGLPAGARLRVTEILSIEPSRIRRWTMDPEQPGVVHGPGFARHN